MDCGRELLHRPVGEAQAGTQEHPAVVMLTGTLLDTKFIHYIRCYRERILSVSGHKYLLKLSELSDFTSGSKLCSGKRHSQSLL